MNTELIKSNLREALEMINSPEYSEGDFLYLEQLLGQTLEEASR